MTDLRPTNDHKESERRLLDELRVLYTSRDRPSMQHLSDRSNRSKSTIHNVLISGRIPSWSVVEDIVLALDGDVDRFRKLYEMIDSERLGLNDRAEELGSELGLPASRHTQVSETHIVSHGGAVYIQSGGVPPFNPLTASAPPDLVSLYESACAAHATGAHAATQGLVRALIEAIGARETDGHDPLDGLHTLRSREVIPARVAIRGEFVHRLASDVVRGTRPPRPDDSAAALSFALALLSCVYLDGRP
ncbi:hypothetical protein ADK67_09320 [Saccharothrix sp. NRRL B-16348]|uniref:hypothetical protein n=1 Tax=Saccharothrix sp. NRRL B-16348 TaxID=1415542 RepID=UPI0006AF4F33|nr:hypothetical protein [Saccharothrix sp. NRRL B-16348]KOX31055.1 hypothetical protein ADK67_09320 [Saccharothrix sp. NRRL B-16348]